MQNLHLSKSRIAIQDVTLVKKDRNDKTVAEFPLARISDVAIVGYVDPFSCVFLVAGLALAYFAFIESASGSVSRWIMAPVGMALIVAFLLGVHEHRLRVRHNGDTIGFGISDDLDLARSFVSVLKMRAGNAALPAPDEALPAEGPAPDRGEPTPRQ